MIREHLHRKHLGPGATQNEESVPVGHKLRTICLDGPRIKPIKPAPIAPKLTAKGLGMQFLGQLVTKPCVGFLHENGIIGTISFWSEHV